MVIRREEGGFFISNMGWGLLLAVLIPGIGALIATGESLREVSNHSVDLGKVWTNIGSIQQVAHDNSDRLIKLEDRTESTDRDRARNIGRLDSLEHLVTTLQQQISKVDDISKKLDKQEGDRNTAIHELTGTIGGFRDELGNVSKQLAVVGGRLEDLLSGRMYIPGDGGPAKSPAPH